MALSFTADQPQREPEPFDPAEGCAIAPPRWVKLPLDLAQRLAAHCEAIGDEFHEVVIDLVELGLDELEEPGDPALSALEDADTFRRDGSPLPDGDDA